MFSMLLSQLFAVPAGHFRTLSGVIESTKGNRVLEVLMFSNLLSCAVLLAISNIFFEVRPRISLQWPLPSQLIYAVVTPAAIIVPCFMIIIFFEDQAEFFYNPNFEFIFSNWTFLLVAAVCEEIIFRLVLFIAIFNITRNIHFTILLSSFLFALVHILNGLPLLGFINIFLAGIVLGFIQVKTRSLVYPSVFHFCWNLFHGLILGFNISGLHLPSVFTLRFGEQTMFNGGSFGLEGSWVATFALAVVVMVGYFRSERRRLG